MQAAILFLLLVVICLQIFIVLVIKQSSGNVSEDSGNAAAPTQEQQKELLFHIQQNLSVLSQSLKESQQQAAAYQNQSIATLNQNLAAQMQQMEQRLRTIELTNGQGMEQVRQTIQTSLNRMQQVQADNLAEIQGMVEQKLTQTLEQKVQSAFQMVNERLEMVYRGLGEMQTLAAGVGDLKKVLSNVKTRGILGEVQLGSILQEILAPEQYAYDVTVNPNRREHVEYAVKLPGTTNGQPVWLPIDSKFPGDTYTALRNALDSGNPQQIKAAQQTLTQVIRKCAKDIHDKYICPPYTTNFAILFLPFEGLYAEVINLGMVETLQQNFQVNIAGPSTMAAMLNALQMGFQTLAIQKRSTEVWQVLQQVQTEFDRFADVLQKTQNALHSADSQLERLVGTRTRKMTCTRENNCNYDNSRQTAIWRLYFFEFFQAQEKGLHQTVPSLLGFFYFFVFLSLSPYYFFIVIFS